MSTIDLELRGVVKRFGTTTALDGLSLTVEKGELITLLGPSGCGKTTALRIIAGYEQFDDGDLLIRGRSMRGVPPYRRTIGMVFQSYALFPHLTVAENVGFGLRERRRPKAAIHAAVSDVLRLVHLEGLDDRYPNQLSGGQQQRVALARALVIEPELLLLDEPLSNLDAQLREEMRIEIKQLQAKLGITTVFVTHDQVEALTLSSRVVVLRAGKIAQIGVPAEVYARPRSRFAFEFLGGTNLLPGRVVERSAARTLFRTDSGLSIVVRGDVDVSPGAAAALGVRPEAISVVSPGIDAGPNRFAATLENVLYRGWTRELLIRLPGGEMLTAIEVLPVSDEVAESPPLGTALDICWSPASCRVLVDD